MENLIVSKSKTYTKGNMPFELTLQYYTTIKSIGEFDCFKDVVPKLISFSDIPFTRGLIRMYHNSYQIPIILLIWLEILYLILLELHGWLRSEFTQKSKNQNDEMFGTLMDENYKVDILLSINSPVKLERGTKLKIIGDLQEHG